MSVLLLSNGAPGYHNFFNALAQEYASDGREVVVAVDCPYSREINELDSTGFTIYEFSSFFVDKEVDETVLEKYSDINLNSALLSDFERNEVYKVSPKRESEFYLRLSSALLSFYEMIFDRHAISEVIYEGVSNSFAHYAYFVAIRKGASYKGLIASRLPGRYAITSDPTNESAAIMGYIDKIQRGQVDIHADDRAWCEDYLSKVESITPDYMSFNKLGDVRVVGKYLNRSKLKKLKPILRHRTMDRESAYQIGSPLRYSSSMVSRTVMRRARLRRLNKIYESPNKDGLFYLYPLHFHPEASTSILAGAYLDEYEVIRNLAFNLPAGHKLYVKDHISAYGFQPISFYKKIKRLPNVVLLGPHENTKALIKYSRGVITLTSTVGYEALLMNKRVFLFGRVFYEGHKNIVRVQNPCEIFELLTAHPGDPVKDKDYNIHFVLAYLKVTRPGVLNLMAEKDLSIEMAKRFYPDIRDYYQAG